MPDTVTDVPTYDFDHGQGLYESFVFVVSLRTGLDSQLALVCLPWRIFKVLAKQISQFLVLNEVKYENIVSRDLYSDNALSWALGADNVGDFSENMGALYALTGCRAPEALTESGTDVYVGYCDAAGEPMLATVATHIGWTLVSGVAGVADTSPVSEEPTEKSAGAAS